MRRRKEEKNSFYIIGEDARDGQETAGERLAEDENVRANILPIYCQHATRARETLERKKGGEREMDGNQERAEGVEGQEEGQEGERRGYALDLVGDEENIMKTAKLGRLLQVTLTRDKHTCFTWNKISE